ncbi:kelch-like protein 1 isoform X2 [Episyrphus balteatus]|uniref:kelch-like protein 1 isoform X2 n=1 Tax=Episyrphus balteatus TaxID=286459 RepID=UPI0024855F89|nr:kelch-like protein 1 isoform X2 [Episyrphus balteatus]
MEAAKNNEETVFKIGQHARKVLNFLKDGNNCELTEEITNTFCENYLEVLRHARTVSNDNVVKLREIGLCTWKLAFDFMYTGSIKSCLETIEELLRIALFFKMNTLVDDCCELIENNINSSNSLKWFRLANELNLPTLKAKSFNFLYFVKIPKLQGNVKLNVSELKELLFKDNGDFGYFEEDIFLSIIAWINYDKLNREHLTFELLSMVRFQKLTPLFILKNKESIYKTTECCQLIDSWLNWHRMPSTRSKNLQKIKPKLTVLGLSSNDKRIINIQTYDPIKNAWWIEMEELSPEFVEFASMIVIDNKVFVVGDNFNRRKRVEYFDIDTKKWIDFPPMKKGRSNCQLADLNGYLCVFERAHIGGIKTCMEIYNFYTGKWQSLKPLYKPTCKTQITSHNQILYILDFEKGFLQSYDAILNKWNSKFIGTKSIVDFGFAAVEGFLYIIGGYCTIKCKEIKTVERYDLQNDSWCEMASLPEAHSIFQTKVCENKIFIVDTVSQCIREYYIDYNTWTSYFYLPNVECNYIYFK